MSIQAVAAVLNTKIPDAGAKLVMIVLANHADHRTGICWPSVKTIAEESSQSVSTVRRYLKALAEKGLISREPQLAPNGRQMSNVYRLHLDGVGNPTPMGEDVKMTPLRKRQGEAVNLKGEGVTADRGEGVTADTPMNHHKEPSEKSTTKPARANVDQLAAMGMTSKQLADLLIEKASPMVNEAHPGVLMVSVVLGWLSSGCDLHLDVIPTLEALSRSGRVSPGSVKSWGFFTDDVCRSRDRRLTQHPKRSAPPQPEPRRRGGNGFATLSRLMDESDEPDADDDSRTLIEGELASSS